MPEGGIVHYFKNVSDQIAQLLCTIVPAGLEEFFEEIGQPAAVGEFLPPPTMNPETIEKLQAIAKKNGQECIHQTSWIRNKIIIQKFNKGPDHVIAIPIFVTSCRSSEPMLINIPFTDLIYFLKMTSLFHFFNYHH